MMARKHAVSSHDPVLLAEIHNDAQAALIVQLLSDHGIMVLRHGCSETDHLSLLYTGATLCGQKLYVSEDQLIQARELLAVYQRPAPIDTSLYESCDEGPVPAVKPVHRVLRAVIILALSIGVGMLSPAFGVLVFVLALAVAWILP